MHGCVFCLLALVNADKEYLVDSYRNEAIFSWTLFYGYWTFCIQPALLQIFIVDDGSDARWMTGDLLERYVDAAFPRRSWGKLVCKRTRLILIAIRVIMFSQNGRRFRCTVLLVIATAQDRKTALGKRMHTSYYFPPYICQTHTHTRMVCFR